MIGITILVLGAWLMFRPLIDRASKALVKKTIHRESGGIEFE